MSGTKQNQQQSSLFATNQSPKVADNLQGQAQGQEEEVGIVGKIKQGIMGAAGGVKEKFVGAPTEEHQPHKMMGHEDPVNDLKEGTVAAKDKIKDKTEEGRIKGKNALERAKEDASQVGNKGQEEGNGMLERAKERIHGTTENVKEKGQVMKEDAKEGFSKLGQAMKGGSKS